MDFLTKSEAEKKAGIKLDGRRRYFVWEGLVCTKEKFTASCSGCFEYGEYGGLAHLYEWDSKAKCHIGSGCDECGYTGKRINSYPCPVNPEQVN